MYQRIILIGHLGKDPEVSYTQAGTARARFSLATTDNYTDRQSGERREETQWHTVIVWGKQAEHVGKYLSKGRLVSVEGKVQYRTYEKDGATRYVTEIRADRVVFLSGGGDRRRDGAAGEGEDAGGSHDRDGNTTEGDNDGGGVIPF